MKLDNVLSREDEIQKKYDERYDFLYQLILNNKRWCHDITTHEGRTRVLYEGYLCDNYKFMTPEDVAMVLNQGSGWFGGNANIHTPDYKFNIEIYID